VVKEFDSTDDFVYLIDPVAVTETVDVLLLLDDFVFVADTLALFVDICELVLVFVCAAEREYVDVIVDVFEPGNERVPLGDDVAVLDEVSDAVDV
jgi:hypothetical protein